MCTVHRNNYFELCALYKKTLTLLIIIKRNEAAFKFASDRPNNRKLFQVRIHQQRILPADQHKKNMQNSSQQKQRSSSLTSTIYIITSPSFALRFEIRDSGSFDGNADLCCYYSKLKSMQFAIIHFFYFNFYKYFFYSLIAPWLHYLQPRISTIILWFFSSHSFLLEFFYFPSIWWMFRVHVHWVPWYSILEVAFMWQTHIVHIKRISSFDHDILHLHLLRAE